MRDRLLGILWARVAAVGLVTGGSAVMAVTTAGGPSTNAGSVALAGQPTLLPLPIIGKCDDLSLSAIVTTVTLGALTCTARHTSEQTSRDEQTGTPLPSTGTAAATSSGPELTAPGHATTLAATGSKGSSLTSSRSSSSTAAGVLGANAGTPSTGTDIAFGIGIGLVIAGAGIGTGTAEFYKRRRTTP